MNFTDLGLRIKHCRKTQNLTQEALAELVDISPHYLYEIERGMKCASLATLVDIATALHTSMDYLLFGNQDSFAYSYVYTDELNEIILDLTPQKRQMLAHIVKTIIPYLK